MQERVTKKKSCKEVKEKNSCGVNCRAYKLYPLEGHLGPGGILIHRLFSTIRKADIFTSSWTLVAKHPCRKTLADNHGLKSDLKKTCAINSHPHV